MPTPLSVDDFLECVTGDHVKELVRIMDDNGDNRRCMRFFGDVHMGEKNFKWSVVMQVSTEEVQPLDKKGAPDFI